MPDDANSETLQIKWKLLKISDKVLLLSKNVHYWIHFTNRGKS